MHESILVAADSRSDDGWLEVLPARTYKTPFYGEVPITKDKLERFVKNFKEGVRGVDIALDFEHGEDPAKGKKAAGWYRDFKVGPSSADPKVMALWGQVEFTEEAKKEIEDKQWKYQSLDWRDEWEDTDGNVHQDVIFGGGLTNRPIAKKVMPINFSEIAEVKEWEHSEPGTGSPPEPRTSEDGSDDIAITEGWRRKTPPPQDPGTEGQPSGRHNNSSRRREGKVSETEFAFAEKDARELLHYLELDSDTEPAKVVESIKMKFGELDELQKAKDKEEQSTQFAERYPELWEEHNQLMRENRENAAKTFSESVQRVRKAEGYALKEVHQGLSPAALESVREVHMKFAEGSATLEDFEGCLKTIMNGGIVRFGEIGSNGNKDQLPEVDTSTAHGVAEARKVFSEAVKRKMAENPEWDTRKATAETMKEHPDLYEASQVALPG